MYWPCLCSPLLCWRRTVRLWWHSVGPVEGHVGSLRHTDRHRAQLIVGIAADQGLQGSGTLTSPFLQQVLSPWDPGWERTFLTVGRRTRFKTRVNHIVFSQLCNLIFIRLHGGFPPSESRNGCNKHQKRRNSSRIIKRERTSTVYRGFSFLTASTDRTDEIALSECWIPARGFSSTSKLTFLEGKATLYGCGNIQSTYSS